VDIYGSGDDTAQLQVPTEEPTPSVHSRYWMVGCIDPRYPFRSINALLDGEPSESAIVSYCLN
jgi:hypothetical protein